MTGSTHANHRSAGSPRQTPEGPAKDNPITGPRTGTTQSELSATASAAASGRHKDPGSRSASTCHAQPPSKSGGANLRAGERPHGARKADRSTESDRTGRGTAHHRDARRHAREAPYRPQRRHTDRCQATTATGCCKPGQRAQPTTNHGTGKGAQQHPTHTPQTPARKGGVRAEGAHRHTHPNTPARSAYTHTDTGAAQEERAHKHTQTPTRQHGVAGRSRTPSPSTHTHTSHAS